MSTVSASEMTWLAVPVSQRDHIAGTPWAEVVMIEYGDYQCPYCGLAYPIVKQLQQLFGESLAFVFRNFPLTGVREAVMTAARIAVVFAWSCSAVSPAPVMPRTTPEQEQAFLAENEQAMARMMSAMTVKPCGDVDREF